MGAEVNHIDRVRVPPFSVRIEFRDGPNGRAPFPKLDGVDAAHLESRGSVATAAIGHVLDGTGTTPRKVLDAYAAGGIEGVAALDGSFVALVSDQSLARVWAVTDTYASRKAYLWSGADGHLITNSVFDGPHAARSLDPAGIACYLASDGCHGGLTPLQGVVALPPSTIVDLSTVTATSRRHWRLTASGDRTGDDRTVLRDEMIDLMRASVQRRLNAIDPRAVTLSLSGGVDSKGLLGLLMERYSPGDIGSFTYYRGEQVGDMDLPEATRIARVSGINHHPILGYGGDLVSLILYNALQGDGMAHFCEEGDVWRHWDPSPSGVALFVGDRQNHHMSSVRALDVHQMLKSISVFPPEAIQWFLDRLDAQTSASLSNGWGERFEQLCDEYSAFDSWREATFTAYLEERSTYTLALWRERFGRAVGEVTNPFLDRALLDFAGSLPTELNDLDGHFLHREAITQTYPGLFRGESAHGGWNRPDWATEIQRNADALRTLVNSMESRLEDLIPRSLIVAMISGVEDRGGSLAQASDGLGWKARRLVKRSRVLTRVTRAIKKRRRISTPPRVDTATLTRRLLTLYVAFGDRDQARHVMKQLD